MKYECHGHIIADGDNYNAAIKRHENGVDEAYVRQNLKKITARGIGYYRDGGDKFGVSAFAKKIAGEYGIDYRTPLYIIHKNGYYGTMYGFGFDNMKEYTALVHKAKEQGADFIKITVSGMLNFEGAGDILGPVFSGSELKEAVNIAEGEGFAVMAHVNGADNIKAAIDAGVKSIEHGFWPDSSIIDYFLQADVVWVPTCATVNNLIGSGRYSDSVIQSIIDAQNKVLIEANKQGVLIATGSDCGAWHVYQGAGTDDEYMILAKLGIFPTKGNSAIAARFKIG